MATYEVHPGESIQTALNSAGSGDAVYVYNGTYPITSCLLFEDDGVSLVGQSRAGVIIRCDAAVSGIGNNYHEACSISSMTIDGNNYLGGGVWADSPTGENRGRACTFTDLEVKYALGQGVTVNWSEDCVISNCHIHHNGYASNMYHNIYVSWGSHRTTIEKCYIHDAAKNMGIHHNGDTTVCVGGIIRDNVIVAGANRNMDLMNSSDCVVYNNLFLGVRDQGLSISSDTDPLKYARGSFRHTIFNNTFVSATQARAITIWSEEPYGYPVDYNLIFNNLFLTAGALSDGSNVIYDPRTVYTHNRWKPSEDCGNVFGTYATRSSYIDTATYKLRSGSPAIGVGKRKSQYAIGSPYPTEANGTAPTTDCPMSLSGSTWSVGTAGPRPIPYPGGVYDIGAYQYGADNTNWEYHVIRPSAIGDQNEWTWAPSTDVTILQRDPDSVYGWATADYNSYIESTSLSDREWFTLANWGATWPSVYMIHNIKVKFLMKASNIAPTLQVSLYDGTAGVGYHADKTYNGKDIYQGDSIEYIPQTPTVCWAEFQVARNSINKYVRYTPEQINSMQLRIIGTNPDGASYIRIYGIELECRSVTQMLKNNLTAYSPTETLREPTLSGD